MAKDGVRLLEHGLRDMYDAEHRFADALGTMIGQVSDASLTDGFRRHLTVTKEQIRRLERAFDELGEKASREVCPGSKGLVEEYERFVRTEKPDPASLDVFAAEAGLKVENYEIAAYRSLLNLAQFMGLNECAKAFRQNLAEEEQAAAELQAAGTTLAANLTGASEGGVVRRAAGTLMDQMREGVFVAAGTARVVGERATRRTGQAIGRAEKRGRRAVRSAQARGRAARTKSTPRSKAGGTRTTSARKTTRSPSRRTTTAHGRSTARKTSRARSTSRSGTRASRSRSGS